MDFYAEVRQVGTELVVVDSNLPAQFSENVPIKINRDPQYLDYEVKAYFIVSNTPTQTYECNKGCPLPFSESGIVTLPREAFFTDAYLFICLSLQKGAEVIYTSPANFKIRESISGDVTLSEVSWERLATEFVENYVKEKTDQILAELKADLAYVAMLEEVQALNAQCQEYALLCNDILRDCENIKNQIGGEA